MDPFRLAYVTMRALGAMTLVSGLGMLALNILWVLAGFSATVSFVQWFFQNHSPYSFGIPAIVGGVIAILASRPVAHLIARFSEK